MSAENCSIRKSVKELWCDSLLHVWKAITHSAIQQLLWCVPSCNNGGVSQNNLWDIEVLMGNSDIIWLCSQPPYQQSQKWQFHEIGFYDIWMLEFHEILNRRQLVAIHFVWPPNQWKIFHEYDEKMYRIVTTMNCPLPRKKQSIKLTLHK